MKKVLQMVMAVLLLVGMLGTQVFADTGVTSPTGDKSTRVEQSFTFKSELSVPADTLVPNVTVSYSIVGEAADGSGRIAGPMSTTGGYVTVGSASFFSNTDSGTSVSKDVTVTFPKDIFTSVGIYRYKITQTIPANTGVEVKSSTTQYQYLDVFVQNKAGDTGLEVAYFVLASTANNTASSTSYTGKSDGFQNTYNSHTLTVKKEVAGNQGNRNQDFYFPITITNSEGTTKKYNYTKTGGTGTFTFTSGTSQTISLKHGETIEITGLTAGDTYTVSEDPADGYTTTYKIDTGNETPYTTALTDSISADRTITFINTKNASTPTGVILTFMPYILMILAGFVVASLFLRRKRR